MIHDTRRTLEGAGQRLERISNIPLHLMKSVTEGYTSGLSLNARSAHILAGRVDCKLGVAE